MKILDYRHAALFDYLVELTSDPQLTVKDCAIRLWLDREFIGFVSYLQNRRDYEPNWQNSEQLRLFREIVDLYRAIDKYVVKLVHITAIIAYDYKAASTFYGQIIYFDSPLREIRQAVLCMIQQLIADGMLWEAIYVHTTYPLRGKNQTEAANDLTIYLIAKYAPKHLRKGYYREYEENR